MKHIHKRRLARQKTYIRMRLVSRVDVRSIIKKSILELFLLCAQAYPEGTPERAAALAAMRPASYLLGGVV